MANLNLINTNLNTVQGNLDKATLNRNEGIKKALNHIDEKLGEFKVLGLSDRKAKASMKKEILAGLKDETSKHITRAYSIAFTASFRGIQISNYALEEFTISQIENTVNYMNVASAQTALLDSTKEELALLLKALKTRVVTSKTFEKKAK